ncbi:unnamed protein product [Linum trigynum]|uniref:C2 NT-type domain-containing protein n=1 Tax=Linum trigynum TaxID=586398 RepID=A0AAV2D1M4_9ROSI
MSRITKWKTEKTKVKVVFRLQFHATHVPQSGWDKLFISLIPADSGKATAKTNKANVRNSSCKWADPIYETTRLLQDIKTKRYDEKLYKLVVSMGSSRSTILGEAAINLSDYAEALKPLVVTLPLHGCDSGTTLHVTVQLLTSKTGFREFEQQREITEKGLPTEQSSPEESRGRKVSSSEEALSDQVDKANSRVRSKEKFQDFNLVEQMRQSVDYAESIIGYDGSSNASEGLYAEKHDVSSTHEIESLKSTVSGDLAGYTIGLSPQTDADTAAAYEENKRLRRSLELAESSIHELKQEVSFLQSNADEIGYEAKNFAKQLTDEIASGEDLGKEVYVLKSECSKLKHDLEDLKLSRLCQPIRELETTETGQAPTNVELQLSWMNGILTAEEKIKELQGKTGSGYHERDARLLHSELEILLSTLQNLRKGTEQAVCSLKKVTPRGTGLKEIREMGSHKLGQSAIGTGFDMDSYEPELGILHFLGSPSITAHEHGSEDAITAMKDKTFELIRELDESKAERENLVKKMDQMECYYEALVQELEENQRQMVSELQKLRNEHSACLYSISSTKVEMETLHEDLNSQIVKLSEEKHDLESHNKELERRAHTAEAALKRARLNYSIAVDQLQKDLELLSLQVSSMFETNENLIRQAFTDSLQSSFQDNWEMEHSQMLDSATHSTGHLKLHNQFITVKKQQLGGDILLDDLKRSLHLQEGLYHKVEEEVCEMHFVNIYLDVFSKILQETLFEVGDGAKYMAQEREELTKQLEMLTEKITESESLLMQYSNCDSQYKACAAEKMELELLLERKTLDCVDLTNQIFSLHEELKTVRSAFDEATLAKGDIESSVNLVQESMRNLMLSSQKKINGLLQVDLAVDEDLRSMDLATTLMRVEEFQSKACKQIIQLMAEKKDLLRDRDAAVALSSEVRSELEYCQRNMTNKFSVSNALVQKLQSRVDGVAKTFQFSSEVEEKYVQQFSFIVSELDHFELELQELASKNSDLALGITSVGILANELEMTRLKAAELTEENLGLVASLQEKNLKHTELSSEMRNLKESLQFVRDENEALVLSSLDKVAESQKLVSELNSLNDKLQSLHAENQVLKESLSGNTEEASRSALEGDSLKETLSFLRDENQALIRSLQEKTDEFAISLLEMKSLQESLQTLQDENKALAVCSQEKVEEFSELRAELDSLKESLQLMHSEKESLLACSREKGDEAAELLVQLNTSKECVASVLDENRILKASFLEKSEESSKFLSELNNLRGSLQSLHDENHTMMMSLQDKSAELDSLKESMQLMHSEKESLLACSREKGDEAADLLVQLNTSKESVASLLDENRVLKASFQEKSEESSKFASELNNLRGTLQSLNDENQTMMMSLQDKSGDILRLTSEIDMLKNALQTMQNELYEEKILKAGLESKITDLTSLLGDKEHQLSQLHQYESDLVHLKQFMSGLETEKSIMCKKLLHYEECLNYAREESASSVSCLETQLSEMHEYSIASHIGFIFMKTQYEERVEELLQELNFLKKHYTKSQMRCADLETILDQSLASEIRYATESAMLLTSLNSSRSELEACMNENSLLKEAQIALMEENKEGICMAPKAGTGGYEEKGHHHLGIERLKGLLVWYEGEVDKLMLSKEELEVKVVVLKGKLDEQDTWINSQEGYSDEFAVLQKQCDELKQKLSEQIFKTEEFRNLSVHLRELKDKADAENVNSQARETRGLEGSPARMQESLRIAFIKEQYEIKLQELKQQLSISKKHSDEMLWKLQDAIDDIESRKKSEYHYLKKNEELGMKILELESELQALLSEKREKVNTYDRMKAELECSLISLDCCKEEKQKLEAILEHCNEEKSRIAGELMLVKGLLEKPKLTTHIQEEESEELSTVDCISSDVVSRRNGQVRDPAAVNVDIPVHLEQTIARNHDGPEQASTATVDEFNHSRTLINVASEKDGFIHSDVNGNQSPGIERQDRLMNDDMKHLTLINDHFRAESLRSSMDHLTNELERMKNENSFLQDDSFIEQKFPDLQSELQRLQQANEELGRRFPSFKEFSGSGNSIDRVLALEMELAEALQVKNQSEIHFQSSFLKQHSDEEAVFKSFRDINHLIQDMLETKGRYTALENELREMHNRYSQLSLQFAEVEGERQKLMMTLKNVRATKKTLLLNRSSSASLDDSF